MNVISLFDGMSCAMIALQKLGIKPKKYFASEIDKYAIQVSKANWPEIIHIGDVTKVHYFEGVLYTEFGSYEVDFNDGLLCGGSPCQGFSFAGKQLNFEDPRSKLFFEFVRIWKEIKTECPSVKVFLENVVMKKEYQTVISRELGIEPLLINSALVSAQNRKRLYWTDIPFQGQPEDRGILLKHILEYEVDSKYALSQQGLQRGLTKKYSAPKLDPDKTGTLNTKNNSGQLSIDSGTTFVSVEQDDKSLCLSAGYCNNPSIRDYERSQKQLIKLGNVNPSSSGMNGEVYSIEGKSPTLTTNKGEGSKIGVLQIGLADDIQGRDQNRRIYSDEGKSPTLIGNTGGHHEPKVRLIEQIKSEINRECEVKILSNGDIRPHALDERKSGIQEFGTISSQENKSSTHIAAHTPKFHNGVTYRKLTVTECERLQNVPDGYTYSVSNTQAYKMLGNGWNVDTIVHLFEPLLWLDVI